MIKIHKSTERGESNLGWLQSHFSFSFADYHNLERMSFGTLRVLNDDIIAPGKGFGTHDHNNMEIITIVTEGILEHKDSTGTKETITNTEIQVMSAGSGIEHSEYNHSKTEQVKLFQIWIEPKEYDIKPRHDKKSYTIKDNTLTVVVSGTNEPNTLYIHQNAKILLGKYTKTEKIDYKIQKNKGLFVFVIDGSLNVDNHTLNARDSAEITAQNASITTKPGLFLMLIEVSMA